MGAARDRARLSDQLASDQRRTLQPPSSAVTTTGTCRPSRLSIPRPQPAAPGWPRTCAPPRETVPALVYSPWFRDYCSPDFTLILRAAVRNIVRQLVEP